MKQKLKTFIIVGVGNFILSYLFTENKNVIHLALTSVFLGVGFALIEGLLKKTSGFLSRKILKNLRY